MSYKILNPDEIEQLKKMALNEVAPKDIAAFFGIGIASVHNHKSKLRDQGIIFPDVRGQRAKGEIDGVPLPASTPLMLDTSQVFNASDNSYRFSINGRSVIVTGPVKNIKISPEGIEVNY